MFDKLKNTVYRPLFISMIILSTILLMYGHIFYTIVFWGLAISFVLSTRTPCEECKNKVKVDKEFIAPIPSKVAIKKIKKTIDKVDVEIPKKRSIKSHEIVMVKLLGVVDGDTVHVLYNGEKKSIRLGYIDAPESNYYHKAQKFGKESKENLEKLCKNFINKDVELTILSVDSRYGRINGLVKVSIVDISTYQVQTGYAWVYPQYNKNPNLPALQETAKKNKLGLWNDKKPIEPWEWRKTSRNKSS